MVEGRADGSGSARRRIALTAMVVVVGVLTGVGSGGGGGAPSSGGGPSPSPGVGPTPSPSPAPSPSPSPATPVAQALEQLEASGALPVLDRGTTLAGTDADADGLRDDLAAVIAARPDSATQKGALRQVARSLTTALAVDVTDATAVTAAGSALADAVRCIWLTYPADQAGARVNEMRQFTLNTRERVDAWWRYQQARSGAVVALPPGNTCR